MLFYVCYIFGNSVYNPLSCVCVFPVPEILCGDPPTLPHTDQVWNGSSTPGSTVTYHCKIGFYHSEGNNVSMCTINGSWTKSNISCKGNNLLQNIISAVAGISFSLCRPESNHFHTVKPCHFHPCRGSLWCAPIHPSFSHAVG